MPCLAEIWHVIRGSLTHLPGRFPDITIEEEENET